MTQMAVGVVKTWSTSQTPDEDGAVPSMVIVVDDSDESGRILFEGMPREAAVEHAVVPLDAETLDDQTEQAGGDRMLGLVRTTGINMLRTISDPEQFDSLEEALDYVFDTVWSGR